jgi:hypothetical protein
MQHLAQTDFESPGPLPDEPDSRDERLLRDFTLGSTFALAFAFISPIVALYAIFPLGIVQVGAGFWLGFPIALLGQLLVAAVFAMLVSQFPYEGSIYQWARLLVGPRYGWFAGWTYMWALSVTISTVAIGAAGFVLSLFDMSTKGPVKLTLIALALISLATLANTLGRTLLKRAVALCISAEIIGSVGVGTVLLLSPGHRVAGSGLPLLTSGAQQGRCPWRYAAGRFSALRAPEPSRKRSRTRGGLRLGRSSCRCYVSARSSPIQPSVSWRPYPATVSRRAPPTIRSASSWGSTSADCPSRLCCWCS